MHIKNNLDEGGIVTSEGDTLPDDDPNRNNGLKWVSGGHDSVLSFHTNIDYPADTPEKVANLIATIASTNSLNKKIELYTILMTDNVLAYIEKVMEKMAELEIQISPYLDKYARWLAFQAPHRGAVKLGIALLGIIGDAHDKNGILILGKHEEFTLFVSVAILYMSDNPENDLWNMAKYVSGWGKIHIVQRLAETANPNIKKWLIREGYKNDILYEYLTYTCAKAGNLYQELSAKNIDDKLFRGAGDIITTLLNDNSPVEDIYSYDEGAEVVQLFIAHMEQRPSYGVVDFIILHRIKAFLESNKEDWEALQQMGWTDDHKANLLIDIHTLLTHIPWDTIIQEQSELPSNHFWQIKKAGEMLAIDTFKGYLKNLKAAGIDPRLWHMTTDYANQTTIDTLITIATEKFTPERITNNKNPNEEFPLYNAFDFFLNTLEGYPGKGLNLIKLALKSPDRRNRITATKVLNAWGKAYHTFKVRYMIRLALRKEKEKDIKGHLADLLKKY
ncbi:hypothetical protein Y10_02080 [Neptunitalea sp. Y10]|uniref:Uncharacterized protein n=1 Tax=Neptunitalea lumnitzerae TaxID=2965509 RepID=A0ABQ5MFN2_9FLAO|nr:hypothetical protein Y10_02080 [Neptunitalea sp. Y10]